jgi:nickel/cobalt transporter (NicO) family protein
MSVGVEPLSPTPRGLAPLALRVGLAFAAVALVAGFVALFALMLGPSLPTPTKTPFGVGIREAAPNGSGLGAVILAFQGTFYRSLQAAVSGLKESGTAVWSLLAIGLAYGVFHAAGPGHGKAVIAAYLVSNERTLLKGFGLSLAAALVQALVAILIVSGAALVMHATAAAMGRITAFVEMASFACVALLGAAITWRKAGKLLGIAALARNPRAGLIAKGCDHIHLPPPETLDRLTRLRDMAGVVLSAGIRPCAGALVVLVFALSQGLFLAGIGATLAMALGTAVTTGAIAALAVFAKRLALRVAGGRAVAGALSIAGIELLAAAFVLVLGASLLFGVWTSGAAS